MTSKKESIIWISVFTIIIGVTFFLRANNYKCMAGDMGLYLQCGQLLLSGHRPYVDFFDTNPPLVMYLSIIPALAQCTAGGDVTLWFQICMLILSISIIACLIVLLHKSETERLFYPALACISLMSALSMFDYGQREYIFFLLFLPYFFFSICRHTSKTPGNNFYFPLALLTGVAAGIGFSLKPHFLIFIVMLEGWTLKNCNLSYLKFMLRPEFLTCVLTGAIYALHFLFLPPDIKFGFFDTLMPMMVKGFAAYDSDRPFFLLDTFAVLSIYSLIAIILLCLNFRKTIYAFPLLLMILSSVILILIQAKNWSYYAIPLLGFSTLSYFVLLFEQKETKTTKTVKITSLIFCIFYTGLQLVWMEKVASAMDFSFAPVVKKFASAKEKVLYLDTTSCPWYAFAAHEDIMPASRYMWLFPITMSEYELGLAKNERVKQAILAREEETIKNILKDANKNKPSLIVCRKNKAYKMPEELNLFQFLKDKGLEPLFAKYKIQQEDANFVYLTLTN